MKIVCHPTSGPPPEIRPAGAERDWMDATRERFAYRCLPLSIANSSGWEILNPSAFSAVWDGGSGQDSIKIQNEGRDEPIAESHFGEGVLTFRVPCLIATEPNVQLWVGGSPNRLKDAIQPLVGIVETDWSPYTFTMNWKFTRPEQQVHFAKDEPFCFIMPISIDLLEKSEPVIVSIDDNESLAANYRQWSASRAQFNAELKNPGSEATLAKWQKSYHQGTMPDGSQRMTKHRTKVRLKKFSQDDSQTNS